MVRPFPRWRGHIDWPFAIFTDPVERSEFYVSRGLDLTLTEFPVAAFDEAITIAGIKRSLPSRIDAYDYTHKRESDNEVGLKRNNTAHDRLQRFESHIRSFIDQRMTVAVGENWIKHRVSGEIRQQWKEKRDKADENGELERPLIDYADFTDYEEIIVRNDNSEEVFAPIFRDCKYFCVNRRLHIVNQPVLKLNDKPVQRSLPVPDRHGPDASIIAR